MLVKFSCHVCGKKLKADADRAGRRARCTACRHAVPIPGETLARVPAARATAAAPDGFELPDVDTVVDAQDIRAARDEGKSARAAAMSTWSLGSYAAFTTLPEPAPEPAPPAADNTCGVSALYLGAVSFALVLMPAAIGGAMAAVVSPVAVSLIYLTLVVGALLLARLGFRQAQQAQDEARRSRNSPAFAQAGLLVNGFSAVFNVVMALALLFQFVLVLSNKGGAASATGPTGATSTPAPAAPTGVPSGLPKKPRGRGVFVLTECPSRLQTDWALVFGGEPCSSPSPVPCAARS